MLKRGDTGPEVARLQALLDIPADGVFGPGTEAAVKALQVQHKLTPDGIAGPATMAALSTSQRLTDEDVALAATGLSVDLATVRAVTEVESRGIGFLLDGRPVILFERHIMFRRLAGAGRDPALLSRFLPTVINNTPGGYLGGADEHDRLYLARQIDQTSAIESASWGLFQIMGFHWERLGYASAESFECRMRESEGQQLDAFVRFIIANPQIHMALRKQEWAAFAAGYNGPAFAKNSYDKRLEAAYRKHAG